MESARIVVDNQYAKDDSLNFFVVTNSLEAPIVCLADNNGYPTVRELSARAVSYQNHNGVQVTIRFEVPANGQVLAINLAQPGMSGDLTVEKM